MYTKAKSIAEVNDQNALQRLYGNVTSIVKDAVEKNPALEPSLLSFKKDIHDIIYALHESPKAVPSVMLPKIIVPLINKLLTTEDEDNLDVTEFTELFANPAVELVKIKRLYQLCKSDPFKSIMAHLQHNFINKYLSRFDIEAMEISKQERAIKFAMNNPNTPPEHKNKLIKELLELARHAMNVRRSFFTEKRFFDHYVLPGDIGYVTSVSYSFDSLRESVESFTPISPQAKKAKCNRMPPL